MYTTDKQTTKCFLCIYLFYVVVRCRFFHPFPLVFISIRPLKNNRVEFLVLSFVLLTFFFQIFSLIVHRLAHEPMGATTTMLAHEPSDEDVYRGGRGGMRALVA